VAAAALAVNVLSQFERDPTVFASFGEESVDITNYAEEQLGRKVLTRPALGHDGKYFFVLANDPWLLDPEENALVIDRPRYRAQRMFYPIVASVGGVLEADAIIWTLLITNVIAMGLGTWAVTTLASDMGGSPWWGLAFVLNVGFISEQNIDGAGVVAAAAAFWAIVLLRREKLGWAVVLLTVSALSREAMLIAAVGSAFWLRRRGEKGKAVWVASVPAAAVAAWAVFVRLRLGFAGDTAEIQEIGLPFVGLVEAFDLWLDDPVDLAAGLAILLLLALFTRRALGSQELVAWAFLGFVPLALLFTRQVWASYFDISRAVAPAITAFFLLAFVGGRARSAAVRERTGA